MSRSRQVREVNPRDDPLSTSGPPAELRDDLVDLYGPKSGAAIAEEFATEEDELNAVLAEAGGTTGGGSVVVRKLNPQTRKFEWLGKFSAQEFVSVGGVSHLASKYGGAEYELIVYGADNRIVKRPKITIAAAAVMETKSNTSDIEKLVAVMAEGFKGMQLQIQQAQPAQTREAFMREMMLMKEFFGGEKQDNTLDTLAKILPIVKEMQPRDGETNLLDTMIKLAKEFGPSITEAVKKTPALAPPGTAGAHPPPNMTAEQTGASQMQIMLKLQLAKLIAEAEADSDPGPYAAIIVTKVKREILEKLVNDPNYLDELGKIHAGVKLFPKWFEELREAVLEELQPEPDAPGVDGGDEGADSQPA
jgi:hypothetical protein